MFSFEQKNTCQSLLAEIKSARAECELFNPDAASEAAITATAAAFKRLVGHDLPEAYRELLRLSDGVYQDGLTLWPTVANEEFDESIVEANLSFRELVHDGYLYLGQRDDSVFVQDIATGRFLAVELNGLSDWEEFSSCEAMIEFMLATAAGVFVEEGETSQ